MAEPFGPPAVTVRGVSKTFRLLHEPHTRVKDRVLHPLRSSPHDLLESLREVSFDVQAGEFFGVMGRNGSGKSTLLRCLSGIYRPDDGQVSVNGRLAPFIELGVGFNLEMSARDNAVINAVMLGLGPREARRRMGEVFAFAELEDFADMRLKHYSSGMLVRLAFSVTVQVDADVLLFDEVLAVGDASFQEKCVERFHQLKDEGRTLVLITHDARAIERFCDRAMLLDQGAVVEIGDALAVARRYHQVNAEHGAFEPEAPRTSDAVEILSGWFEDADGNRTDSIPQGKYVHACLEIQAHRLVEDLEFVVSVRDESHRPAFRASSRWGNVRNHRFPAGSSGLVRLRFHNWLGAGRYRLSATVLGRDGGWLGERSDVAAATVYGPRVSGAVADLPHSFEVMLR
jgi:ABC-type polysaccharide/polyol phosphate transport system ATPase subunit